jgi:hypothetical protein
MHMRSTMLDLAPALETEEMTDTTLNLPDFYEPTLPWRRPQNPLAIGLLLAAMLASVLADLAIGPIRSALAAEPTAAVREWPHRPLEREWRGYRTPVDADGMFMQRR